MDIGKELQDVAKDFIFDIVSITVQNVINLRSFMRKCYLSSIFLSIFSCAVMPASTELPWRSVRQCVSLQSRCGKILAAQYIEDPNCDTAIIFRDATVPDKLKRYPLLHYINSALKQHVGWFSHNFEPPSENTNEVLALMCTPRGNLLFTGKRDGTIERIDFEKSSSAAITFRGKHDAYVTSLACTDDGSKVFSASGDDTLCMWDTGEQFYRKVVLYRGIVLSVACSGDGSRIFAAPDNKTGRMFEVLSGKQQGVHETSCQPAVVTKVACTRDGKRAFSGMTDGTISMWDIECLESTMLARDPWPKKLKLPIQALTCSSEADERLFYGIRRALCVFELFTQSNRYVDFHDNDVCSVVSNDKQVITGDADGKVWLRYGQDYKKKFKIGTLSKGVKALACSHDGSRIFAAPVGNGFMMYTDHTMHLETLTTDQLAFLFCAAQQWLKGKSYKTDLTDERYATLIRLYPWYNHKNLFEQGREEENVNSACVIS